MLNMFIKLFSASDYQWNKHCNDTQSLKKKLIMFFKEDSYLTIEFSANLLANNNENARIKLYYEAKKVEG